MNVGRIWRAVLLVVIAALLAVAVFLLVHRPGLDCSKYSPSAERQGSGCIEPVGG